MNCTLSPKFYTWPAVLLLALYMSSNTAMAQSDRGLTPMQVAKMEYVSGAVISEDGKQVAYTRVVPADPAKENKRASSQLYVYDVASGTSNLFYSDSGVRAVQFRPGHKALTFLSSKPGDNGTALYQISLTGGEAQKLYAFRNSIIAYEWADDGKRIAFTANEPVEETKKVLPYEPEIYEENLVQRRGYVVDVTSGDEASRLAVEGTVYTLKWNPEGDRLAVASAPTPLVDDYYMHQQLFIADPANGRVLASVDHEGKLGQFEWSPDGKQLAMIAGADIHDTIDGRLMVVDFGLQGGTPRMLAPGLEGKFEQFQWVDNRTLNYLLSKSTSVTYGSIRSDGSNMKALVNTENLVLRNFSRAENGTAAFVADSPIHPNELYMMKRSGKTPERVTDSNPWLADVEMGRQEVVTWSARDGLELQGLLIYPVNYDRNRSYPMITVVHGGPEAHYSNGWLTNYSQAGQLGAARGFAVFYPNYRGSTGRGVEFAMSSQKDLAGAEFDDIVDGVDHLIDAGIADKDRIGVTGGSYGGYATGWMSTRYTDRFAAGVMFVGISNNISKWGTSDIPEELFLVHARERLWDNYQGFLERSPIYYAGQAKTPLLIMHGKEDTRVHPGQSYELFRHIKTRTDTPVRLVFYPGEGHGNANATARYDYTLRSLRWFETYLKGDKTKPGTKLDAEMIEAGK